MAVVTVNVIGIHHVVPERDNFSNFLVMQKFTVHSVTTADRFRDRFPYLKNTDVLSEIESAGH